MGQIFHINPSLHVLCKEYAVTEKERETQRENEHEEKKDWEQFFILIISNFKSLPETKRVPKWSNMTFNEILT